jgi:hypothetical protein
MLSLQEFAAGRLCDAKPMSLFMPSSKYDATTLVVGLDDGKLFAVVLEGSHAFKGFDCTDNKAWRGMIIHPVAIEVDEKSLLDLDRYDPPSGSLTRKGDLLSVMAHADEGFRGMQPWKLVGGLPTGGDDAKIGFTRWSVVLGNGQDKRVLFTVDRPRPKND